MTLLTRLGAVPFALAFLAGSAASIAQPVEAPGQPVLDVPIVIGQEDGLDP